MTTLKGIINYEAAPLSEWEEFIGEEPSKGKLYEDALIYPEIKNFLSKMNAKNVTGIIADEGRLELFLSNNMPELDEINHLTLSGNFNKAALANKTEANDKKVKVTVDLDDIKQGSQDAVVLNMVVSTLGSADNIKKLLTSAGSLLKENGKLIIVTPHLGGDAMYHTYARITPRADLKAGESYKLKIRGIDDIIEDMYTPSSFLGKILKEVGLTRLEPQMIQDKTKGNEAPFVMYQAFR